MPCSGPEWLGLISLNISITSPYLNFEKSPVNLILLTFPVVDTSRLVISKPELLASAFNTSLPPFWIYILVTFFATVHESYIAIPGLSLEPSKTKGLD